MLSSRSGRRPTPALFGGPSLQQTLARGSRGRGGARLAGFRPLLHRRALGFWGVLLCLLQLIERPAYAEGDPHLAWWTLETAHFRVHYSTGLEPIARRVAAVAESVNDSVNDALGWRPTEPTEIVLSDSTDVANGEAYALPYNAIRLYVTAPEDLATLGDYDDLYLSLLSHEYTHVVQSDSTRGFWALVNRILGKSYLPGQVQPRWILEGLAVHHESRFTGGGRDRSSLWDMYLRADVLENNLATLDQMTHDPRRWPEGNTSYLYGSRFFRWLGDVYGEDVFRAMAVAHSEQPLPWGANRTMRRLTGRTYEELYSGWVSHLKEHYGKVVEAVDARGLREGTRLTHHGRVTAYPRWVPPTARSADGRDEILYFCDDRHGIAGLYRVPFSPGGSSKRDERALVVRMPSLGTAAFDGEGGILFNAEATTSRIYQYSDLHRLRAGETDTSGFSPKRERLTFGKRAQQPDVSRDGRHVVFTENHRGTTSLVTADIGDGGELEAFRVLVRSRPFEQAYSPRFSPDGAFVVYSSWSTGGYRDLRIVSVATGEVTELTHDRAMDLSPSFSPDGALVFFSSDRVGRIPNIFALERATGRMWQVTNVRLGALSPEVSPDGKWLLYVGYSSAGYDLSVMPLRREDWPAVRRAPGSERWAGERRQGDGAEGEPTLQPGETERESIAEEPEIRPDPLLVAPAEILDRHPYRALPTLRPRAWRAQFGQGTFGQALGVVVEGADIVRHHSVSATVVAQTERFDPEFTLAYGYHRLPFDMYLRMGRYLAYRKYDDRRFSNEPYVEEQASFGSEIRYRLPYTPFEGTSLSLGYTVTRVGGSVRREALVDPWAKLPSEPARGVLAAAHVGVGYEALRTSRYAVGPAESGFSFWLRSELASPWIGSEFSNATFSYATTAYFLMPWASHHTLAIHAEGGISGGRSGAKTFQTGGIADTELIQASLAGLSVGTHSPFVLRGYNPMAFSGRQYQLTNLEYRLPLSVIDRGMSTLPFFLQRICGNLFADYGGAFDDLGGDAWTERLHLGVGAELWFELTLGYAIRLNLRVGHARGIADRAAPPNGQTYFVAASAF